MDYLKEVQQEIIANPKLWLKYTKIRSFLKSGDYISVATIFKKNIVEAIIPAGLPAAQSLQL